MNEAMNLNKIQEAFEAGRAAGQEESVQAVLHFPMPDEQRDALVMYIRTWNRRALGKKIVQK